MYLKPNDVTMDGLGKSKFLKKLKKTLLRHPLAPPQIKTMALMAKKKKAPTIAPVIEKPIDETFYPMPQLPPIDRGGFYPPYYAKPMPQPVPKPVQPPQQFYPMPQPVQPPQQFYPMPQPVPVGTESFYPDKSARYMPGDMYARESFDDSLPDIENIPAITPYESAAASVYGNEEGFEDSREAYESEAGYLNGLGQESGSTGGWFSDLISQGTKAAIEIQKARAAAKAAKAAPVFPVATYRPSAGFGGVDMNMILMVTGLGLGGFLLYKTLAKKRR